MVMFTREADSNQSDLSFVTIEGYEMLVPTNISTEDRNI